MQNGFLSWLSFSIPKRGNAPEECEDAFAGDPATGRFAIADGASESAFAGDWSRILVGAFVAATGSWKQWLPTARQSWHEMFQGRELPWYAEEKFEQGAFATVLGLTLTMPKDGPPRSWRASAIGDACLFQIRHDALHRSFPFAESAQFNNRPELLCSRARTGSAPKTKRKRTGGDWHQGDLLLLMTDALAQWFLEQAESGKIPWKTLIGIQTKKDLAGLIEELRDRKELRNDDVTLLLISPK